MNSIIIIDGVQYDSVGRSAAYFNALDSLTLNLDGGYDELAWTILGVGPVPPFTNGKEVMLQVDTVLRFKGDITRITHQQTNVGWAIRFSAIGLKNRADHVTIAASDGTGNAVYNRASIDPYYIATDSGLTVGTILQRILTIADNASALYANGIGAYVAIAPYSLPAITTSELSVLDIVPPSQVMLSGENLFGELESLVQRFHPKYVLWIQPDGTIRCTNVFAMPTYPLVIPGEIPSGPDITSWPSLSRETSGCYTAFQFIGQNIKGAICSELDLTLKKSWDSTYDATWTLADFTNPKDAINQGAISNLTTGNAVVTSSDNTVHWTQNFWNDPSRQGIIAFLNPAGTGITLSDTRVITSCTAMSPGGSATITWDATEPLDSLRYSKYRIVARSGPRADVGRRYTFATPAGLTGLNTWVGAHVVKRFPYPVPFANNSTAVMTSVAIGVVSWSSTGAAPFSEFPVTFEVIPSTGEILLTEPIWKPLSTIATLNVGIPTTYANGKYVDLKVIVPYNRGALNVRKPISGFEGRAFTEDNITLVKTVRLDAFSYAADAVNIAKLAQQHLDVVKDPITAGSILCHGIPVGFDPLALPYALNLSVAGVTSQWDGVSLPVRSVTIAWPQGTGDQHACTFNFSNMRRPFQGDDLYIHPLPGGGDQGPQGGGTDFSGPFGQSGPNTFMPSSPNSVQPFTASPTAPAQGSAGFSTPEMGMPGLSAPRGKARQEATRPPRTVAEGLDREAAISKKNDNDLQNKTNLEASQAHNGELAEKDRMRTQDEVLRKRLAQDEINEKRSAQKEDDMKFRSHDES